MNDKGIVFNQIARKIAFDDEHYEMMMSHYHDFICNFGNNTSYYSDLELEKKRAANIRSKAFKKLDKQLVDFDTKFTKNGGKIFWANDADDARKMIYDILSKERVKKILKSKKKVSFFELFKEKTREYVVVTFLTVLEMAKNKEIIITQENNFNEIYVSSRDGENND